MPSKTDLLDLIHDHPVEIGLWVGFRDLTELHNGWLRDFLFAKEDITRQAHRGSYKTTTLSIGLALFCILHPNKDALFFRKTDSDTREVVEQVANILRTGAMQEIVRTIYGRELLLTRATASEITTSLRGGPKGSSQLLGLGIKTSITGKHGDLVATDDIVNIKDRYSRAEREEIKRQYLELKNVVNRGGGRFINTGTPWHKDDAFSLMPNISRVDCYESGLMTAEEIRELRESMPASLFAANYELKHIAPEDVLFEDPKWESDAQLLEGGICHVDAAFGGGDSTAFTAINELQDGRVIVYGRRWDKHVDDCLDEILREKQNRLLGTTYMERNADKGYLAKELRSRGDVVQTYHEKQNKHIKISTHLKGRWKDLYFLEDTDPGYMEQVLEYNENASHDDCPDSLASLLRQTEQRVKIRTFREGL